MNSVIGTTICHGQTTMNNKKRHWCDLYKIFDSIIQIFCFFLIECICSNLCRIFAMIEELVDRDLSFSGVRKKR